MTRVVSLPDPIRVARARRAPELGPRLLFFTGGTALRELSRYLKSHTHNSTHLMSPFDSGGSSADLRRLFGMMSVGDLRNRLLALADESVRGNPQIYELMSHRLIGGEASTTFARMVSGEHHLITAIPQPMRRIIQTHLRYFAERMPNGFELQGASVGNLLITGGYLNNERNIDSILFLFSKLVNVHGIVRPIVHTNAHLAAALEDGSTIIGQHLLTGKEVPPITSAIRELFLVDALEPDSQRRVHSQIDHFTTELIAGAEVICYPMGSFYSSVIANLLPRGVGQAIVDANCPKIYIPNVGQDPEQLDMSVADCVRTLVDYVNRDLDSPVSPRRILNFVLIDSRGFYPHGLGALDELDVDVIDVPLLPAPHVSKLPAPPLGDILLSLA